MQRKNKNSATVDDSAGLLLLLLLQNLYSTQIQASSSQRRWCIGIARWGTWLAGVGKKVSFETAFERANGW